MPNHEVAESAFAQYRNIEAWLDDQPDTCFPIYYPDQGEISYPERYQSLKQALVALHNSVEKGALVESYCRWQGQLSDQLVALESSTPLQPDVIDRVKYLMSIDPLTYLNQHGTGHVNKVAEKAFELIKRFTCNPLSATEVFILLCAIQVHDTGNIFGRDGHEVNIRNATIDLLRPIIPDVPTQNLIYQIAKVHSGRISGSKDTIGGSSLNNDRALFDKPIRALLVAALLRFADELADDSSRADKQGLRLGTIPTESIIYHQYSNALHAVNICKNEVNQTLSLSLNYYVDSQIITRKYIKKGQEQLLLDEIFTRTKKVEQERRYCMRYFSQYLPIVDIRVQIQIDPPYDDMQPEIFNYTLKENGYPAHEITIDCQENTGELVISTLVDKGWVL